MAVSNFVIIPSSIIVLKFHWNSIHTKLNPSSVCEFQRCHYSCLVCQTPTVISEKGTKVLRMSDSGALALHCSQFRPRWSSSKNLTWSKWSMFARMSSCGSVWPGQSDFLGSSDGDALLALNTGSSIHSPLVCWRGFLLKHFTLHALRWRIASGIPFNPAIGKNFKCNQHVTLPSWFQLASVISGMRNL